jgi:hypothetical protein
VSEDELLASVTDLAKWLHLLTYHTRDSRRSSPGFPDLVAAGPRGCLFIELKSDYGMLSPRQVDWKFMLLASGQQWRLWRPADWADGTIDRELRSIA